MVERRLTRRDQAGLPQPARAGLLASSGGARETHTARETTEAGTSFFTFLSHITRSQHKRRISHQTSNRNRNTSAGDWRWRVYTNNVATTTTNGADLLSFFLWSLAKFNCFRVPIHFEAVSTPSNQAPYFWFLPLLPMCANFFLDDYCIQLYYFKHCIYYP